MIYYYRIKVLRVLDGDTVDVELDLGFGVSIRDRLRLAGIDAPEVTGGDRPEGITSKLYLIELLAQQPAVYAQTYKDKRGKYGRMLATLFAEDGLNLNDLLVARGYARRVAMFGERWD